MVSREAFLGIVRDSCKTNLRVPIQKVLQDLIPEGQNELKDEHLRNLFFGNYMEPDADPRVYTEVPNAQSRFYVVWENEFLVCFSYFQVKDYDLLVERMTYYLNEYNLMSQTHMNLVLFKFAIEHISRVSRVLQQDNGHCLLVGIGGSGRQSATKLAASMQEFQLYQVMSRKRLGRRALSYLEKRVWQIAS